jgi:hypothetical protein
VHNARTLAADLTHEGASVWDHYARGPDESMWYYRRVADIVRGRLGGRPLVDELDETIAALEKAIAETGTG